MSEYRATVEWHRGGADFTYEAYSRLHAWRFEGGIEVAARAAPENIPRSSPLGPGVDPEQAFVASLSACHMLWFLHLACRARLVVDRYVDEAVGILGKDAEGRMAMLQITLRPVISYAGHAPTAQEHAQLHHEAHEKCFIANSVTTAVRVEPRIA